MSWFEAILLGIVQGLTEFLPISSTGHVRVVPALLGQPDPGAAFSYRHSIGADDIAVLTNLTPEFASPLGSRTVADRAQGARFFGCEAALISGPRAGSAFRPQGRS